MTAKTKSEKLFEDLCKLHSIRYKRIPCDEQRTPDYDIFINRKKIVVEIKQMDSNPKEQKQQRNLAEGNIAELDGTLAARGKRKMKDTSQISRPAKGEFPSILILYNNVDLYQHTDPINILSSMYGSIECVITTTKEGIRTRWKFGGKRRMTKDDNTSISAVGVLMVAPTRKPYLLLYHNYFAAIRLDYDLFKQFSTMQYKLTGDPTVKPQEWVEVNGL
jgi:hypothetical protein